MPGGRWWPDIIHAVQSPYGLAALMILLIALVAIVFFWQVPVRARLLSFASMLVGVSLFIYSVASLPPHVPSTAHKEVSSPSTIPSADRSIPVPVQIREKSAGEIISQIHNSSRPQDAVQVYLHHGVPSPGWRATSLGYPRPDGASPHTWTVTLSEEQTLTPVFVSTDADISWLRPGDLVLVRGVVADFIYLANKSTTYPAGIELHSAEIVLAVSAQDRSIQ